METGLYLIGGACVGLLAGRADYNIFEALVAVTLWVVTINLIGA